MSRSRTAEHIEAFEEILHALELRGIEPKLFLYAMTDIARHHDMNEVFAFCGDHPEVRPGREAMAVLRRAG